MEQNHIFALCGRSNWKWNETTCLLCIAAVTGNKTKPLFFAMCTHSNWKRNKTIFFAMWICREWRQNKITLLLCGLCSNRRQQDHFHGDAAYVSCRLTPALWTERRTWWCSATSMSPAPCMWCGSALPATCPTPTQAPRCLSSTPCSTCLYTPTR